MPSGGIPYPAAWAAAQAQGQSLIQQLINAASGATRRQSREGRQFIRGLTRAYAGELRGIAGGIGATYDEAQREQSSMNAALGAYLGGQGQQQANALGGQLSWASPAAQQQFGAGQAAVGQTGANVGYAMGAQNLNRVTSEAASERAFGQSLPGTAYQYGMQSARQFEKQQGRQLQDQIAQIRTQGPALASDLYSAFSQAAYQQQQLALQRDQMELEERSLDQQGTQAGNERLDNVRQMAYEHMKTLQTANPNDPNARRSHDEVEREISAFYRNYYPNAPRDFIDREVYNTIGGFDFQGIGETPMAGFLEQLQSLGGQGSLVGELAQGRWDPRMGTAGGYRTANPFTSWLYGRQGQGGQGGGGPGVLGYPGSNPAPAPRSAWRGFGSGA